MTADGRNGNGRTDLRDSSPERSTGCLTDAQDRLPAVTIHISKASKFAQNLVFLLTLAENKSIIVDGN